MRYWRLPKWTKTRITIYYIRMRSDQAARREYWRKMMEAGYEFMMTIRDYPVQENQEPLVSLPCILKGTGIEVLFSRRRLMKARLPIFRLRSGLAGNFLSMAEAMNRKGWILRVEDAYRNREMQNPLKRKGPILEGILKRLLWESGGKTLEPDFIFRRLTVLIATIPKIGTHMSGSALDISVVSKSGGNEVERGAPYLETSELTPMDSPFITPAGRKNRRKINELMLEYGFRSYPFEFWHYSSGDAYAEYLAGSGRPGRYGPVDLVREEDGQVRAIKEPKKPLITIKEVERVMMGKKR